MGNAKINCSTRYWNRKEKQYLKCSFIRKAGSYCSMCDKRKDESYMRRRYFPFKWNKDIILDITI